MKNLIHERDGVNPRTGLFQGAEGKRYGGRWRQRLFIPKYLTNEAQRQFLFPVHSPDEAFSSAHRILGTWADLEASGKLLERGESEIKAEFLTSVFGQALGYKFFSENLPRWELSPEFPVPGIGTADAGIGFFEPDKHPEELRALVEVKGPSVDLDRSRFAGRTPVRQLWDYMGALPGCPWGILTNCVSFRLYHQDKGSQVYQEFILQDLKDLRRFREFYYLFERAGLLPTLGVQAARADRLLEQTDKRQRDVGPELYKVYRERRQKLIHSLRAAPHNMSADTAIRVAQKLLDRIIFIAFCEDRQLLPSESIEKAWSRVPPFTKVTNPRWQNFLELFVSVNEGNTEVGIPKFNGGLFGDEDTPELKHLQLDDSWTDFFKWVGTFDFSSEVTIDVLGHIFEQSVSDLEALRSGGLFAAAPPAPDEAQAKMPKSAQRKRTGVFYTPPELTGFITRQTLEPVIVSRLQVVGQRHGLSPGEDEPAKRSDEYWRDCFDAIRQVKICDPACGSGAFLIQAYDIVEKEYIRIVDHLSVVDEALGEQLGEKIPDIIVRDNLYGVDLSRESVEITQLSLWIRTARRGKTLADLSGNIVCGNSLVSDPQVDARAVDWAKAFPPVFEREEKGFDCVVGNPPWERMKLQEREFFDASAPEIAAAVSAATRRALIAELERTNPELYRQYMQAKEQAERSAQYVRDSGKFPLTGKGDVNLYVLFAELARSIVGVLGRVGLLVPSGIATDHTTRDFFAGIVDSDALIGLYDFENKKPFFPDVHRSFKFSVLLFGGSQLKTESADFVFFAHTMNDLEEKRRHIRLSAPDLKLLNPNTRTCPIFRTQRDAEITKGIYRRVPVLIDRRRRKGGNPWGISFCRMFDQTNDAELFHGPAELKKAGFRLRGNRWTKARQVYLPLYEAKMVQAYDHRAAGVVIDPTNWMRQGQTEPTSLVQHQNPEFLVQPRWWVKESDVLRALSGKANGQFIGFKDITSPTNERTVIAAAIPWSGVTNHFPLTLTDILIRARLCLLATLNSFVLDFVARQKMGGVTLNFFIMEQLPVFPPSRFAAHCPWNKRMPLEKWISDRALKLTCTSEDMAPLAKAARLSPPIHPWNPPERAQLLAELDAAFFILYGLDRDDVEYILSTFPCALRVEDEIFGSRSPRDAILQAFDNLAETSARA